MQNLSCYAFNSRGFIKIIPILKESLFNYLNMLQITITWEKHQTDRFAILHFESKNYRAVS